MSTSRIFLIAGMLIAICTVRSESLALYGVCDPLIIADEVKIGVPPDGGVTGSLTNVTMECACQQNQPDGGGGSSEVKWQTAHKTGINLPPFPVEAVYDKEKATVTVHHVIQPGPSQAFNHHFNDDGTVSRTPYDHTKSWPNGYHVCNANWYEINDSCSPRFVRIQLDYLRSNDKSAYRIIRQCTHQSGREANGVLTSHVALPDNLGCSLCNDPNNAQPVTECPASCRYSCTTVFEGRPR